MDQLYLFIKKYYKHERFEGRNGPIWGSDYSQTVYEGYRKDLERFGFAWISKFESVTGNAIRFTMKDVEAGEISTL